MKKFTRNLTVLCIATMATSATAGVTVAPDFSLNDNTNNAVATPTSGQATNATPALNQGVTVAPTSGQATNATPALDQGVTVAPTSGQATNATPALNQGVTVAPTSGQATNATPALDQGVTAAPTSGQDTTALPTSGVAKPAPKVANTASDKALSRKVEKRFADYDYLDQRYIDVSANENVVTVSGRVDEDPQFEQAYFLAATTPEVTDVDFNDLEVRNGEASLEDRELNAQVKVEIYESGFERDEDIANWAVKTRTEGGTVYLDGTLPNEEARLEIAEMLYAIPAVESVKTNVKYGQD